MKTLKIPDNVHKELKVFVATSPEENMTDFAGFAIMERLRNVGHRFVAKPNIPAVQKISQRIKSSSKKPK